MSKIMDLGKIKEKKDMKKLKIKAALFDELVEFLEDKCLGYLMKNAEKEKSIPLSKAKKLLRA